MSRTADCVKLITATDLTPFDRLIEGDKTSWKRVSKFLYRGGIRRYFYLLNSCLIATIDEPLHDGCYQLKAMVRPPMLWEIYMLQDLRPNDQYLAEDITDLQEKHYDFVTKEAAKGSEAYQYYFMMGSEDGGWIFFGPHKQSDYDQHLSGDLYDLLPTWLRENEVMECTYDIESAGSRTLDDIKQELIDLGFEDVDEKE